MAWTSSGQASTVGSTKFQFVVIHTHTCSSQHVYLHLGVRALRHLADSQAHKHPEHKTSISVN